MATTKTTTAPTGKLTKSAQIKQIASNTCHSQAVVEDVLNGLANLAATELRKGNEFVIAGVVRLRVVEKPGVPAGPRKNPFNGRIVNAPAKPPSKAVKARASKTLLG